MDNNILIYFIVCVIIAAIVAYIIARYLNSCPHDWKYLSTYIHTNKKVFFDDSYKETISEYRLYECQHCNKLKKEYY